MSGEILPVPTLTLNNGLKMPAVGVGCWMGAPGRGEEAYKTVSMALKLGYRHVDTVSGNAPYGSQAMGYGNEEKVGEAIRDSGIPREEIFVTTKLPGPYHGRVEEGFTKSLEALNVGYIDLFLMHWPQAEDPETGRVFKPEESPTYVETWKAMEKLLDGGKVKSIGVSNFSIKTLEVLLPQVSIVPVTNQVELHPCLPSFELFEYCKKKNIVLTAYTPMGRPSAPFYTDPEFVAIAEANKTTPGQILVSWAVQRGTVPIPMSTNEGRLKNNITLVKLSEEDMKKIDEYHKKPGMHKTLAFAPGNSSALKGTTIFGWEFEWMGWNWKEGGYWKD